MTIDGEYGRVQIATGRTGNTLDPDRRVPLSRVEFTRTWDRVAVRSRWPVAELITHRAVQVVADIRAELREAGDPDPQSTIVDIAVLIAPPHADEREPESEPADLAAVVLATAYPLLAPPLAAGARPVEVPVVLEPLLRHATARDAAQASLRPTATTRPLVRALAQALMPNDTGTVAWERPLLALMAAARCGPEQLTSILSAAVHHAGAMSFSVSEVRRAQWMLAERNPRRIAETLCAALEQSGGTADLAREIAAFGERPPPLPPPTQPVERRIRPVEQIDVNRRPILHPPSLAAIEGMVIDGLQVRLPRIGDDLLEWAMAMNNCLGAYRGQVAIGRTHIIGFSTLHRLEVVAEVSRGRVLRQLEGPGNMAPSRQRCARLIDFLREHRVVEADGRLI